MTPARRECVEAAASGMHSLPAKPTTVHSALRCLVPSLDPSSMAFLLHSWDSSARRTWRAGRQGGLGWNQQEGSSLGDALPPPFLRERTSAGIETP